MTNLARHLVSHVRHSGHLLYRFPNGQEASVIPDLHRPLHWELLAESEPNPEPGLTTAEVEARLAELAALPMLEWDGKS
jgi:hypothetical protein